MTDFMFARHGDRWLVSARAHRPDEGAVVEVRRRNGNMSTVRLGRYVAAVVDADGNERFLYEFQNTHQRTPVAERRLNPQPRRPLTADETATVFDPVTGMSRTVSREAQADIGYRPGAMRPPQRQRAHATETNETVQARAGGNIRRGDPISLAQQRPRDAVFNVERVQGVGDMEIDGVSYAVFHMQMRQREPGVNELELRLNGIVRFDPRRGSVGRRIHWRGYNYTIRRVDHADTNGAIYTRLTLELDARRGVHIDTAINAINERREQEEHSEALDEDDFVWPPKQ